MKISLLAALFLAMSASAVMAAELECASIGENRLNVEAKLQRSFFGKIGGGSYVLKDPVTGEQVSAGEFSCEKVDKIAMCKPATADANVGQIIVHPVMGFLFVLEGQQHVALLDCKSASGTR
jgi:hypothetical protein